jgi:hypothetical protein
MLARFNGIIYWTLYNFLSEHLEQELICSIEFPVKRDLCSDDH